MVKETIHTKKIDKIASDVELIKEELIEKIPAHFSAKRVAVAFMGAFIIGLTFTLKGLLLQASAFFTNAHALFFVIGSLALLSGEIYFVGYNRVKQRKERHFFQFWIKRLVVYYGIALFASFVLVYLYAIDLLIASGISPVHPSILNVVLALSLPCALGASLADLLKQY